MEIRGPHEKGDVFVRAYVISLFLILHCDTRITHDFFWIRKIQTEVETAIEILFHGEPAQSLFKNK